ncbi:MAG: DUF2141 domain-containing protein [Colwellia sp.]
MLVKKLISYSAISLFITVIGSSAMIISLSQKSFAANLTVNISDVEQGKGQVLVALFSDKATFISGKSSFSAKVKASHKQELVIFKDLPDGDYAVKMFQDENSNRKLDFNFMGIPKEGYGFSNNVGMFGQPDYKEAKFVVKGDTIIDVELF